METILLDQVSYTKKPTDDIAAISSRITDSVIHTNLNYIADKVGNQGHTWCPAIFTGQRRKSNFKQIQLIALDFDEGVSFEEVKNISEEYMIPIVFAYETFSSVNCNRFRVIFKYENMITDINEFNIIIDIMMKIFDGCDTACKDVSRMFFGGKNLFYFDNNCSLIYKGTLFMNFYKFMKDCYGEKHYKAYIRKFADKHKISIDRKEIIQFWEKSPFVFINTNINTNGEKVQNHKPYRKNTLNKLYESCTLYREFADDSEWLYYKELYGIALNLMHIETGKSNFLEIIENSQFDTYKRDWKFYLSYFKDNKYLPMNCDNFCPHKDTCSHGCNMLCSASIKRKEIIRLKESKYVSIEEAYSNLRSNFEQAKNADNNKIHLIKAQTAIGKTHMYLEFLKRTDMPCIIAVPTNILKNEVYDKCLEMGINAMRTPSIEEIKYELPDRVYNYIQRLYKLGKHNQVSKYISYILKKENIPSLSEYVKKKDKLKSFDGHIITTHHRLLYANKDWLKKYQVIIDEDILKTMISNQEVIYVSDIEDALDEANLNKKARHKLVNLIDMSAKYKYFSTEKCKEKVEADVEFDINLLLKTKRFYSDGEKIVFYKTPKLQKMKYIVLSATADEYIYKKYFGEDRICFYNCRHAGYKGVLKQYYDHSYSRNYISKTNDAFEKIKEITGNIPAITFKKYADCDIHFGNSEGCNVMSGEDIAVVGTPHMAEFIYKLLAHQMDGDVSDNLHYREVEYNQFKFWFHTYKDELLRRIQFWLIESELEQSVGRARLLRNDCTVHLFSDFPLGDSVFVKSD